MIQRLEQTCWKCQSNQAVIISYNDYSDTVIFYISITLKVFWKHFEVSFSLKVLKGHFLPLFQILRKRFDRINGWTCAAPHTHLSNHPDLSHPVFIWLCRIFVIVKIFTFTFIFFNFTAFRWYHLDDWVSFYFFALLQFCAQGGVHHSPHPSLRLDVWQVACTE